MTHPALQRISDAAAQIRSTETMLDNAFDQAEGVQVDDNEHPAVLAVVKRRRLVRFEVDTTVLDTYAREQRDGNTNALDEFNILINAVIQRAFAEWQNDYNERIVQ